MTESAHHLVLVEHDSIDPWWSASRNLAGSATLVEQLSEATEQLLRRTARRAQDLRKAGYVLDAAYFVLGRGNFGQLLEARRKETS